MGNPQRTILTIIMDVLVVLAIAEVIRLVVMFFGQISSQEWAKAIIMLTDPLTVPFGIDRIHTEYAGSFDVNAAVTVVVLLLVEWVLSIVRPGRYA